MPTSFTPVGLVAAVTVVLAVFAAVLIVVFTAVFVAVRAFGATTLV